MSQFIGNVPVKQGAGYFTMSYTMREIDSVNPGMIGIIPRNSVISYVAASTSEMANNGEYIYIMLGSRSNGSAEKKLLKGRGISLNSNTQDSIYQSVAGELESPTALEQGSILYCDVDYKKGSSPRMKDLVITIALSDV